MLHDKELVGEGDRTPVLKSVLPDFCMRFVPVGHLEKREAGRGHSGDTEKVPRQTGETTDRLLVKAGYADGYKDFMSHK